VSVRHSEYERLPGDLYITPQWVWDALYSVEPWARDAWDCCPVNPDFDVFDIKHNSRSGLATNPPYGRMAEKVIRHALMLSSQVNGKVAMLLPHAYDCAKGRVDLFNHLPFKRKWTLTERIQWDNLVHTASPSSNHAWYIWDWKYIGPPKMGWL
jgi:hypothetical protein